MVKSISTSPCSESLRGRVGYKPGKEVDIVPVVLSDACQPEVDFCILGK